MAESFFSRAYSEKTKTPSSFILHFSPEKITRLLLLKEVKPPDDRKMIKLLTFDNSFPHKNP